MATVPAVIEVFADVACPFTHVGLRRLVERRAEAGRSDVALWVRSWPLELVNGAPLDPDFIAEEVVELRHQVAPELFGGFQVEHFPATSLPALALSAAAYERGLDVGEAVSLEVRDLLFEQGIDIADVAVLSGVAARHGLDFDPDDPDVVLADRAEGERRGVIGSPHYFTGDGGFFCPALEVGRDDEGHLRVLPDPARFDAFVAACFAEPARPG